MAENKLGIIALVLIIGAGAWYMLSRSTSPETVSPITSDVESATSSPDTTVEPQEIVIAYTVEGFSPKEIVVTEGASVRFVNQTSEKMWVASGPHPTHEKYSGTTLREHCATTYTGLPVFDQCSMSPEFVFTFTKVGTWNYHNHSKASDVGSVTVTARAVVPTNTDQPMPI